jgi:hypothetical protein
MPDKIQTSKILFINFDTSFRGRNEVQKNKWTPHYQTEFDGESEKITVLCVKHFNFGLKNVVNCGLKKRLLTAYQIILLFDSKGTKLKLSIDA